MVFNSYKCAKFYGEQKVALPPELKKILTKWASVNPTDYLLFDSFVQPLLSVKFNQRLNKLFDNKQNDVAFGLSKQPLVVEILTKYFDEPITETKHKFCRYDAYSNTTKYEIKSRRCRYKTFATTIIPVHKVKDIRIDWFLFFTLQMVCTILFMMQIYLEHINKS